VYIPKHSHANEWHRFIIHCNNFYDAARIAAKNNWWLHCWDWQETNSEEIVIIDTWIDGEIDGQALLEL